MNGYVYTAQEEAGHARGCLDDPGPAFPVFLVAAMAVLCGSAAVSATAATDLPEKVVTDLTALAGIWKGTVAGGAAMELTINRDGTWTNVLMAAAHSRAGRRSPKARCGHGATRCGTEGGAAGVGSFDHRVRLEHGHRYPRARIGVGPGNPLLSRAGRCGARCRIAPWSGGVTKHILDWGEWADRIAMLGLLLAIVAKFERIGGAGRPSRRSNCSGRLRPSSIAGSSGPGSGFVRRDSPVPNRLLDRPGTNAYGGVESSGAGRSAPSR